MTLEAAAGRGTSQPRRFGTAKLTERVLIVAIAGMVAWYGGGALWQAATAARSRGVVRREGGGGRGCRDQIRLVVLDSR